VTIKRTLTSVNPIYSTLTVITLDLDPGAVLRGGREPRSPFRGLLPIVPPPSTPNEIFDECNWTSGIKKI